MAVLAVVLGLPGSAAAAQIEPPPDAGPCNAQDQALYTAQQAIERHNAQPHDFRVPQQQAAPAAYDAEAAQLNTTSAAALAALEGCVDALDSLGLGPRTPPEIATTPRSSASGLPGVRRRGGQGRLCHEHGAPLSTDRGVPGGSMRPIAMCAWRAGVRSSTPPARGGAVKAPPS